MIPAVLLIAAGLILLQTTESLIPALLALFFLLCSCALLASGSGNCRVEVDKPAFVHSQFPGRSLGIAERLALTA